MYNLNEKRQQSQCVHVFDVIYIVKNSLIIFLVFPQFHGGTNNLFHYVLYYKSSSNIFVKRCFWEL